MPSIDKMCDRMEYLCAHGNLGYDQSQRWNIYEGGECDCSSLVVHCADYAGFDTGGATYTGNMRAELTARGWVALDPDTTEPRRGDILLHDTHHVALYLGGGRLAQASIDERGEIAGGAAGDQIDYETNVRPYYDYPWLCYLRYTGGQTQAEAWGGADDTWNPNSYGETYTREVQTLLNKLGYDLGPDGIDGVLGRDTHHAVKRFQTDNGLLVDGIPGPTTLGTLRSRAAGQATPQARVEHPGLWILDEDGAWGPATTRRAQAAYGTPQDSEVSSQAESCRPALPAAYDGWEFLPDDQAEGSQLIAAMQRALATSQGIALDPDGIAGPQFATALANGIGAHANGQLHEGVVTGFQRYLNRRARQTGLRQP